jgi:hypothetical protein
MTPGRLLVIATPSGVERFFEQCAELLPGSLDMEALAAITEANWCKTVGPPQDCRPAARLSARRLGFPIRSSDQARPHRLATRPDRSTPDDVCRKEWSRIWEVAAYST